MVSIGTTACKWDYVIPFNKHIIERVGKKDKLMYEDEFILYKAKTTHESIHYWQDYFKDNAKDGMWERLNKLIKPNGAIVLFGSEPFSSALRMSNIKNYKYDWIWKKEAGSNFATVKYQPMKEHEIISIFTKNGSKTIYNPQMQERIGSRKGKETKTIDSGRKNSVYGTQQGIGELKVGELRNPSSVQEVKRERGLHPTQKPVALMEYLIKTYTNEGGSKYEVITPTGITINEEWRFKKETYNKLLSENKLVFPRDGDGKPRYKLFLNEKREMGVIANTWWDDVSSNQEATKEIKDLFNDEIVFDTPKPTEFLEKILQLGTKKDDLVLDFFSGSASLAHAVFKYNIKNQYRIKFILVQLPEKCENNKYLSIAEIGKERIRRAGKKILEEKRDNEGIDIGFKVLKLE